MNTENDLLEVWRKRIVSEKKYGDYLQACRIANISPTTYQDALKKSNFEDLTKSEIEFFKTIIDMLDQRKVENKELVKKYANNG